MPNEIIFEGRVKGSVLMGHKGKEHGHSTVGFELGNIKLRANSEVFIHSI